MMIMGFDAGNSETTVAVHLPARTHHLTFPSSIGSGDHADLLRVRSGAGGPAALLPDAGRRVLPDRRGTVISGLL
jgi:hypothetical protein